MMNFTWMGMIKNLKIVLALIFSLYMAETALGQDRDHREKIKALKVAFFTEQLNLGPEEAKAFWPLYNQYEQEREVLMDRQREEVRDRINSLDTMSEKEAEKILNRYLDLEEQEEELDRRFYQKLSREFSATRTLKLFKAERDFRRRLLQEYRKRGGSRP